MRDADNHEFMKLVKEACEMADKPASDELKSGWWRQFRDATLAEFKDALTEAQRNETRDRLPRVSSVWAVIKRRRLAEETRMREEAERKKLREEAEIPVPEKQIHGLMLSWVLNVWRQNRKVTQAELYAVLRFKRECTQWWVGLVGSGDPDATYERLRQHWELNVADLRAREWTGPLVSEPR